MTVRKSLTPISRWADAGSGFNSAAAEAVYQSMAGMDADTALVYGRILLADSVRYDLNAHRSELAKAAEQLVTDRAETLRSYYTRQAVAKARAGEDNTHEIGCIVQIGKAFDFTAEQRRDFAAGRTRGDGGRFAQEHRRIDTDSNQSPMDKDKAKKGGVPEANHLEGADLAHYQQGYQQIRDLLAPFQGHNLDALLHLNVINRAGKHRTEQLQVDGKAGPDVAGKLHPGDRIDTAVVSLPINARSVTYDIAGGAAADLHDGVLNPARLKEYNSSRKTPDDNEFFSPTTAAFGRLSRGSQLLQDSIGPTAPVKLQYALAVANHVGQFGPEAQKVIGPAADRAAYRYRGTQRTPDPDLRQSIASLRQGGLSGAALRNVVIGGQVEERGDWNPGPVLRYFHSHLPNADLNELQRKSGVIPPSEGIIIAADGRIATQSVGFADDWYLPFNLRNLASLKGGEYIRTRSFGGPTTEDVYTGLISGAKSVTVVSHNGVYTIDFDRNLRGGRRFNDKAARMVGRYGQLLDAVRSGQVERGGVSPSRMSELRAAAADLDPDENSEVFRARLGQLQNEERRSPNLSQQERGQVAVDWLGSIAAKRITADGRTMTPEELTGQLIDTEAKNRYLASKEQAARAGVAPILTQANFREQVAREVTRESPEEQVRAVAEMAGGTRGLDRALSSAEAANRDRVTPLQLDGKGYSDALTALQEQFPYYIGQVSYHPWRGAVGVDAQPREGARDTGYVAPRHNRPAAALAGYFNPDVNGRGKVEAQSTRYQNYRVRQGQLTAPGDRAVRRQQDTTAATTTPAGAAAADDGQLQRASDLAMLDELLSKKSFAPGAKFGEDDVSGLDIRQEALHPRFPNAALKRLYTQERPQLEALPSEELHDLMRQVLATTRGPDKVFAVNDATAQTFLNKGKVLPAQPIPATIGEMLAGIGQDHRFPGAVYDPLQTTTTEAVERTYSAEPAISSLVGRGELLAVSDPAFGTKVTPLQDRLAAAAAANVRHQTAGGRVDPVAAARDKREADGLLRATQLNRRWIQADANRPPPAAPVEPASSTLNQVYVMGDPSTMDNDTLKRLFDPSNIADSDPRHIVNG